MASLRQESHKKRIRLRNYPDQVDLRVCLWGIVLIDNWCRKTQPIVGGIIPKARVLNSIRKLAESKQGYAYSLCF